MSADNAILIDTDPGVDDYLAILLAVAAGLPVRAVTSVFGNASVAHTTVNALTIMELLHADVPVYRGAEKPLLKSAPHAQNHGDNGLGGFALSGLRRAEERASASEFLARYFDQPAVPTDVLCLGPLTNIAHFLHRSPHAAKHIRRLIVMGGVIGEKGNVTAFAEFNAYCDPDALHRVLQCGVPVVLIPADVCRRVVLMREDIERLAPEYREATAGIVDTYIRYYTSDAVHGGFAGGVMYDVLTVAYLLDPSLFTLERSCVDVDVSDGPERARTVLRPGGTANCLLARSVDARGVKELMFRHLSNASVV